MGAFVYLNVSCYFNVHLVNEINFVQNIDALIFYRTTRKIVTAPRGITNRSIRPIFAIVLVAPSSVQVISTQEEYKTNAKLNVFAVCVT